MESKKNKKILSRQEAYLRACAYCAYQERYQEEVRRKLILLNVAWDEREEIISDLIRDNYLNEERFAKAYAGGKFRIKHWGRIKIQRNLEQKGLSKYCVKKAMEEIPLEDYYTTINKLIEKRSAKIEGIMSYEAKQNIAAYLMGKGYEPAIVWEVIGDYVQDDH